MDGVPVLVGHAAEWTAPADPSNPGFHAISANAGIAACQACHGQDLAGGAVQRPCGRCHDQNLPPGISSWKVNCTMCHGTDSQTGAPPVATWGNDGDPIRVGAHTRHVAGSAIAPAFDCVVCHTKPADALSTNHIDGGTAEVIFAGIAAGGPTWVRSVATCAVYCHGATLDAGGTNTIPSWTGGPVACGDCHGAPPPPPHPVADLTGCGVCHRETMDATGAIIPASAGGKHLNGIVDGGLHVDGWRDRTSANFHAYSANRGLAPCQECHGVALDGVGGMVSIGCQQCHGATWKTNCTMCHGATDNATGAPPRATWGSTSVVAIGAHTSHVGPNPVSSAYGCVECHVTPTDALSPGHIGGSAVVSFAGPVSGLKGGTWNYPATGTPTCSSTYCHGNFARGIATNAPNWNGTNQAACGTCHVSRPGSYLHRRHQRSYAGLGWWPLPGGSTWVTCDQCHLGIAASVNDSGTPTLTVVEGAGPALHVDGKPDVVFKAGGTYEPIDPFQATCSSMACHPGEVKYWPR
jgi:predicted CxxxxCH...CXXCH cytochrome family protein